MIHDDDEWFPGDNWRLPESVIPPVPEFGDGVCSCAFPELPHWAGRGVLRNQRHFRRWVFMHQRCYRPASVVELVYYQLMGVTVCPEWHCPRVFIAWCETFGTLASPEVDRVDPDGDYCPANCELVPRAVNQARRRELVDRLVPGYSVYPAQVHRRMLQGASLADALLPEAEFYAAVAARKSDKIAERWRLDALAASVGMSPQTLRERIARGMSEAEALAKPVKGVGARSFKARP